MQIVPFGIINNSYIFPSISTQAIFQFSKQIKNFFIVMCLTNYWKILLSYFTCHFFPSLSVSFFFPYLLNALIERYVFAKVNVSHMIAYWMLISTSTNFYLLKWWSWYIIDCGWLRLIAFQRNQFFLNLFGW